MWEYLGDLVLDGETVSITPNTSIKDKLDWLDFIKMKNFHSAIDCWENLKRVIDWEKIFANNISDKNISRIHKDISKLLFKTTSNPVRKWAKNMKGHFTKEDIQMGNKHMKRCSISLVI